MTNTTNKLAEFFKASGTPLGSVFYPTHFVVATFRSYNAAQQAARSLREASFPVDEMVATSSHEAAEFFEDFRESKGAWGEFMESLSRTILSTQARLCDAHLKHAKEGASFIAIHSLTQDDATQISQIIRPYSPLSMQWYRSLVVENLV